LAARLLEQAHDHPLTIAFSAAPAAFTSSTRCAALS
jgi:hypothetical protein